MHERPRSETSDARGVTSDWMLQLGLVADIFVRVTVWTIAAAVTLWWGAHEPLYLRWPDYDMRVLSDASRVARDLASLILAFNVAYVFALIVVRLPIARPRPGTYRFGERGINGSLFRATLLGALARARYQPMFPAFLVPQLAGIIPFRWLLGRQFGPRTSSSFWGEPMVLDPSEITIGRNVLIGYDSLLSGHIVTRDEALVGTIVIEDDVLVGGRCVIAPNVHIERGAVVGACSYVAPGTRIGPNEFWAGVPAKHIKTMPERP